MFEFLLVLAFVIAFVLAYFFFKNTEEDSQRIVTKLESLNNQLLSEQANDVFPCRFEHAPGKVDQLMVLPANKETTDGRFIGIVPYDYKPRILHYMNTPNSDYKAEYNKASGKLTIDLIE